MVALILKPVSIGLMGLKMGALEQHKTKRLSVLEIRFVVDPAGLAPASSGANSDVLLYTSRAQVHDFIIYEKSPFYKGHSS